MGEYNALLPLEERSCFCFIDLLDSVEVPMETFIVNGLVVLT
jgi:hypothetical protein